MSFDAKREALARTKYLQEHLKEYREVIHRKSVETIKDTLSLLKYAEIHRDKNFKPLSLHLDGFDNLDRIVRDVELMVKKIEDSHDFVHRLKSLSREEMLTSDDPLVRQIVLLFTDNT